MNDRSFCVYNQDRECFLSLGVVAADTMLSRLKGLIGRCRLGPDDGIWVVPSHGVHTFGVLFPLDLIYLDEDRRVIHTIEHFPRFKISPLLVGSSSVLQLPTHTIYSSQTEVGDRLVICSVEQMAEYFCLADESRFQGRSRSRPSEPSCRA